MSEAWRGLNNKKSRSAATGGEVIPGARRWRKGTYIMKIISQTELFVRGFITVFLVALVSLVVFLR
jgi:hypothetical protein